MHTSTGRKIILLKPTTYGDVRCRNGLAVEAGVRRKPKPDVWAVVTATMFAAVAFWILCDWLLYWAKVSHSPHIYYEHVTLSMLGFPEVLGWLTLATLLFIFVYPLMGLIVSSICGGLAAAIARIYKFEPGERRHPNAFLLFASSWPVTIWTIPLLAFAWGMGLICKFYWK